MALSVCQVMLSTGFGGAERLFVDLCLALADRGCRVQSVCQPSFQGRDLLAADERIEIADVHVRGNWDLFASRRMQSLIEGFSPDLIHSHLARGALHAGRCAEALGIPLVANLHNYIDLKYYRRVDRFLPGTNDQAAYLEGLGVARSRIHVVPHFTRIEAASSPRADGRTFVSYGRMVRKKGFDLLLGAFARLHAQDTAVRLLLGGDGPERAALESLAVRLGIQGAVEFSGWIEDAGAFLDRGDVFVLPSRDEPFGIVVLEAMARGKAIVASRTAGPVEVLDKTTACLFETGDEESLASAMASLYADRDRRESLARRSLTRFVERYSEQAVLPQFMALYRPLADAPDRAGQGVPRP